MTPFRVSIVIPTYNRSGILPNLLGSLEGLIVPDDTEWEILVVDNNSRDATRETVERHVKEARIPLSYHFEKQQGSSHARNRGVRESKGEVIAFVDDDVTVDPGWLKSVKGFFERNECIGMGGRVLAVGTENLPKWVRLEGPYKIIGVTVRHDMGNEYRRYETGMIMPISANLALRRTAFEKHGFFRTDLGRGADLSIVAGEDTELCLRLLGNGETLMYSPDAVVYHPIDKERISKRYCRRFYFWLGQGFVKRQEGPVGGTRILNVPVYLFRDAFLNMVKILTASLTLDFGRGFYHQLHLILTAGKIYQSFLIRKPGRI